MNRIDLVVAGIDGSPQSLSAARWAAQWCTSYGTPLQLVAITGSPTDGARLRSHSGANADQHTQATEILDQTRAELAGIHPRLDIGTAVWTGTPADQLVDTSRTGALVVIGTRGVGGALSAWIGGVATGVVNQAPGPVIVVPVDLSPEPEDVVALGIDPGSPGTAAAEFAVDAAARIGASLRALAFVDHQGQTEAAARSVRELLARPLAANPGLTVDIRVEVGPASWMLGEAAADCRLLVLGARRRRSTLAGLLLGSTSKRVVRDAQVATAVVRDTPTD
ncbi:MAG: universal stress protein [Brooklawnia sp.]|jgi:nucleotide-binding universal stress UspA family protein